MAKISIIVPIYKVEPYLHRCIDSILAQTFADFDLVLVDDGSPDRCPQICDEYAAKDPRIHVIHQENGGLSAARNAGIDWVLSHSDSEWIGFIDSDDWIHPEMYEILYRLAIENNVKISICDLENRTGTEEDTFSDVTLSPVKLFRGWEFFVSVLIPGVVAVNKLYHRTLFDTLRYPVGKLHEDEFLTYRLLGLADTVAYLPQPLYFYRYNEGSIMNSGFSLKRLHAIEARLQQRDFYEDKSPAAYREIQRRLVLQYAVCITGMGDTAEWAPLKKELLQTLRRELRHNKLGKQPVKKAPEAFRLAFPRFSAFYWRLDGIKHYLSKHGGINTMKKAAKKLYGKWQKIRAQIKQRRYTAKVRRTLNNENFSIICSNCIGGFIYHRLGQQFLSPTINMWFLQPDFLKFIENLPYYLSLDLEFIASEYNYPVARLGDITLFFNHSKDEQEASRDWYRRRERVNYDNMYVIMYERDGVSAEDLRRLEKIPCNNKIVLSAHEHPDMDYVLTIKPNDCEGGVQYFDTDAMGFKTFEKHFDFVKFLNHKGSE